MEADPILHELSELTGVTKRTYDDDIKYRKRLIIRAHEVISEEEQKSGDSETWAGMSPDTAAWLTVATEALNGNMKLPKTSYDVGKSIRVRLLQKSRKQVKSFVTNRKLGGASNRCREMLLAVGVSADAGTLHKMLLEEGYSITKKSVYMIRSEFAAACRLLHKCNYFGKTPPKGV